MDTVNQITSKLYRCTKCGHIQQQSTNHYSKTWSWGHTNTCPKCSPYEKYPEYGGCTIWECTEIDPNMHP